MRVFWLLLTLLLLVGCERAATPPLIHADELAPREAEIGDRLEVRGSGFPKGRAARVSFRGTLHRPGEASERADIEAEGTATSAQKIELTLTDALEASFCGRGERAAHTTFRGDVEVAFPAIAPGAPPVAAEVHEVVLDLRPPSPARSLTLARRADAEQALAFLGLAMDEAPLPSGGLAVRAVTPGSRAEEAHLASGDVVTGFDGVRVGSLEDLVPSGDHARVAIGFRRGAAQEEIVREIRLDGWQGFALRELAGAAAVLLIAAAFVLLFFVPGGGLVAWLEARAAATGRLRDLVPALSRALPSARAGIVAAVAASLVFAVMPFGRYVVLADLDIAILLAAALAALATMGAASGGFGRALQMLGFVVPQALAILAVVALAGSPRVDDIVRGQGAAPWDWFAFRTPATFLLFCLHLSPAAFDPSRVPPALFEADGEAAPATPGPSALAARWACVVVTCGTSAALFLGGWQLPLFSLGQQHGDLRLELLGSAVYFAKAVALLVLTWMARRALPALRAARIARLVWRWLVPLAVLAAAASMVELVFPFRHAVLRTLALGTFAVVSLAAARFFYGVRFASRRASDLPRGASDLPVDPFV
jgi:NADH-quinone oxidoreductase subunit H